MSNDVLHCIPLQAHTRSIRSMDWLGWVVDKTDLRGTLRARKLPNPGGLVTLCQASAASVDLSAGVDDKAT